MKKRLESLLLIFILFVTQVVNLNFTKVKAAENDFSVQIVVESNKGVIISDTSKKSNAYDALVDVLSRNNISYDFPATEYGPQIKTIKDVTMAADWSTYWYYYGKRNDNYLNLDIINSVTMQNGDKLIVAFQNAATKLVNKISYSTNKENTPLTITFESTSLYDPKSPATPIKDVNAKIYNAADKTKPIFEGLINDNKINFVNGLKQGQYVIELSDFKTNSNEFPKIIADSFTFNINSDEQNNNNPPTNPYDRDNTKIVKDISAELNATSNFIKGKSAGDSWAILSLTKLGEKPSLTFIKQSAADIKKNKGISDFTNTDLEKLVMVLTAAGYTPYNFMGYNLVSELYNRDINSFLINDALYGLMTLNYANINGNYSITRDKLVDFILNKKLSYKVDNTDIAGWSLTKDKINPDITGFAINALSPYYNSNNKVKEAVDSAVNSLSKLQNESGYIADNYGYFSESLDAVILGLTAIGINPEGEKFTKTKGDLVSALLSFKGTDNQFKHSLDGKNDYIASEQALRALIALKEFKAKGIYNYYSSNIDSSKLPEFTITDKELLDLGVLPQTGSPMDLSAAIGLGIIFMIIGVVVLKRKNANIK